MARKSEGPRQARGHDNAQDQRGPEDGPYGEGAMHEVHKRDRSPARLSMREGGPIDR